MPAIKHTKKYKETDDVNMVSKEELKNIIMSEESQKDNPEDFIGLKQEISRDELFDFIKKIEKEVEKTSSLMDNMLYWSRNIQKGDQNKSTVINIYEIIQQNISLHHDKLLWKEISCKNLVDPTVRVCLDINTLNLCLRNLISNAIKFTPATGLIEIGFNQKGGFAEFFLSDTGVGIPVERQKKLFCICRDSVQGTEGEQGAGMGLHIVKEFLDRIGGYIRYENKPDRGSTFVFGLPCQQIKQRFHRAESMSELEA